MKIKNLPRHERPREKLIEKCAIALKDKELLAILLGTGRAGKNVIEVAAEIFAKHKMKKLLALPYSELAKIKGIGPAKTTALLAAFELTKRALEVEDVNSGLKCNFTANHLIIPHSLETSLALRY